MEEDELLDSVSVCTEQWLKQLTYVHIVDDDGLTFHKGELLLIIHCYSNMQAFELTNATGSG